MESGRIMRKKFRMALSKQLLLHNGQFIKVICGNYGVGKTRSILAMADSSFPVVMGFYTRELRDKTYRECRKLYPNKRAIKLESPLEKLEQRYGFDTKEFLNQNLEVGDHFTKVLRAYLELVNMDDDKVVEIFKAYKRASTAFKKQLGRFFAGDYDIAFITQQGLMLRILHSYNFQIPDHINVVFDELEVGLWTEDETTPQFNNRAKFMLGAGGKWSILTGDTRPVRFRMPEQFKVVDRIERQFVSPIALMTHIPLTRGDSIKQPTRGGQRAFGKYLNLKMKFNHHNREIALPLIVAEERAKAKWEGKKLLLIGNVGKYQFSHLAPILFT